MQSHVSKYIAGNFAALRTNPEMVKLLSEGGNIVIDVMGILSNGSITLPSVPITPIAPRPTVLRSGPVPQVVLPPVPSPPAVSPSVVPSMAAPPTGPRPITLASVVSSPAISRSIALPAVTMDIVGPGNRYISQLMASKSSLQCEKFRPRFHERVYALGGKSGNITVGKDP